MKNDVKFTVYMDQRTHAALKLLAESNQRTMGSQLRELIVKEAIAKSMWRPRAEFS